MRFNTGRVRPWRARLLVFWSSKLADSSMQMIERDGFCQESYYNFVSSRRKKRNEIRRAEIK